MRGCVAGLAVVAVSFLGAQDVEGAHIFTTDVTFVDGDDYWSVEIHEDAHAEVLGGDFGNRFQLCDNSTAHVVGGNFRGAFVMGDDSRATVESGTYINTYINMLGSAELDIFGGRMPDRYLEILNESLVTFHGYSLTLDPSGGSEGDGLVSGVFADGTSFAVNLRGDAASSACSKKPFVATSISLPGIRQHCSSACGIRAGGTIAQTRQSSMEIPRGWAKNYRDRKEAPVSLGSWRRGTGRNKR